MFAYCGNNPVMFVDYSGEFPILIAAIAIVSAWIVSANIGTVIASEIYVSASNVEPISDDVFQKYNDPDEPTYGMSHEKRLAYIRRIRLEDPEISKNWTEAEMMREMTYHDSMYEIFVLFKSDPSQKGTYAYRTKHVDFEKEQTTKTYLRRFIGNIAWW